MTEQGDFYLSPGYLSRLGRRRMREQWLKLLGIAAILIAVFMLFALFGSIAWQSRTAFVQTQIELQIFFDPAFFPPEVLDERKALARVDYGKLVRRGVAEELGVPKGRRERREMAGIMSGHAADRLRDRIFEEPEIVGQRVALWLPASDDVDMVFKGVAPSDGPESRRRVSDRQLAWLEVLEARGRIRGAFNTDFFTRSSSRDPEVAGIWGAVVSSFLMLAVTLSIALPIGVGAAIYLEQFAPHNRITALIDINIRNLAAIPSIVVGLFGLALFIAVFGIQRSTPIVGGLVLALMTLPTIVIASRAAIQAVPPSLYEAALQLGASKMQAVTLTVLPNALPGILTGTIIGMAQALGETAPLLMVGMMAFVADPPRGFNDPAAPLPVQIYLWATSAERGFGEKTAAAIIVLLVFLIAMNGLTIYLRRRFERRSW